MKAGGGFLLVVGGILVLIGFIWGWVIGYYPNELPVILVLLAIGAGSLALGGKLYSSAPDARTMTPPARQPASTHWLAESNPTVETPPAPQPASTHWLAASAPPAAPTTTTDAEIGPDASAGRLAGLAADPALWPQIEAHPNVYPALLDWIRAEREGGGKAPLDAVVRASDPATPPGELAELAEQHPELRAAIAANPAAYPGLREWIAQNGSE